MVVQERQFAVNGYRLAAKEWHKGEAIPVIALHGWLDNAASFDELAPLLKQCHIIALDLPGHGLSDHKHEQASYNIWDDLRDILAVADSMGWQQFHLLGHSRGAIMSVLLAAAVPERITSMLLLDAVFPPPFNIEESPQLLGRYLRGYNAFKTKNRPSYDSVEQALASRLKAMPMGEAGARKIVERGSMKTEKGIEWRTDSRLTLSSAVKFSEAHIEAMMKAVNCPNLVILAKQGAVLKLNTLERLECYPQFNYHLLAGGHHFHMDEAVAEISELASEFFASHHTVE